MRIYSLAKELGERYSIEIKSADLAEEIREAPEFASIKDSVKSHASSVGEDVAEKVRAKYAARFKAEDEPSAEELATQRRKEEAERRKQVEERRSALAQKKLGDLRPVVGRPAAPGLTAPVGQAPAAKPGAKLGAVPLPVAKPRPGSAPTPPKAATPPPAAQASAPSAAPAPAPEKAPAPAQAKAKAKTKTPAKAPAKAPVAEPKVKPAPLPRTGMRSDGQPLPPRRPNLGFDSPFRPRPPAPLGGGLERPVTGRAPQQQQQPQGRDTRRPPGRGRGPAPGGPQELVIPEIQPLSLKQPPRRSRANKGKKKGGAVGAGAATGFRPSRVFAGADEFKRPIRSKPGRPAGRSDQPRGGRHQKKTPTRPTGPVHIGSAMTLGEFARRIGAETAEVMTNLLMMGHPLTVNQLIDPDLCEVIAQEYGVELVVELESDENDIEIYRPEPSEDNLQPRPPVVTIMGHVDHGKTTLLDAYRSSDVAAGEHGAITQHIGAYHVDTPRGKVIFLDTPGHEAFTTMRARGASVTDMVILVVAADDGVMPQTIEAINHAKEAEVPLLVAINKIDLPAADPTRVRNELMQHAILPEELGGDHIFVELSAKQGTNLDQLLEMILLQAEMLELTADPDTRAEGRIIESHVDPMRGAVATVLIQKGTLNLADIFVVGAQYGRVRAMIDDQGKKVKSAGPSIPVEISGLTGSPEAGEIFLALAEERIAREIAENRLHRRRVLSLSNLGPKHVTLEGLHDLVAEGKLKELKIVLKADVQGSLEAVTQSLAKLGNEEVSIRVLHGATGPISESDVTLASASNAVIVGFNVRPDPAATQLAEKEEIEIKTYRIIYELIEEFQKAVIGMLDKRFKEIAAGRVEIRQIFKMSKIGNIAGCMVVDGEIARGDSVRLVRDGTVVYEGKLTTLRRHKDDAAKVAAGFECGLTLENFQDIKEGDIVEVFRQEEIPAELVASSLSS